MAEIKNRRENIYVDSVSNVVNRDYKLIYDEELATTTGEIVVDLPICDDVLVLIEKQGTSSVTCYVLVDDIDTQIIIGSSSAMYQSIQAYSERGRLFSKFMASGSISASQSLTVRSFYGMGYYECHKINKIRLASASIDAGSKIKIYCS